MQQRSPVFDQMIVNGYQRGEGIKAHVDLLKFDDGIAVVSLAAPAVMTFTKAEAEPPNKCHACVQTLQPSESRAEGSACISPESSESKANQSAGVSHTLPCVSSSIPAHATTESSIPQQSCSCSCDVLLEPGDLLLLHGEARYDWKHGIQSQTYHSHKLTEKHQSACRVSLTFRRLVAA